MSICLLNHEHVHQWETSGVRPSCQYHHHTSFSKARKAVAEDNATWIPELRAIVMYTCVVRYVWQGRRSGGFSTLQFTSIVGRKAPTGLCSEARRNTV